MHAIRVSLGQDFGGDGRNRQMHLLGGLQIDQVAGNPPAVDRQFGGDKDLRRICPGRQPLLELGFQVDLTR